MSNELLQVLLPNTTSVGVDIQLYLFVMSVINDHMIDKILTLILSPSISCLSLHLIVPIISNS